MIDTSESLIALAMSRRPESAGGDGSIAGRVGVGSDELRRFTEKAHNRGFSGVVLDGTAAGLRARELDRSARREIAALIRRAELEFGGLDLWIPPRHFAEHGRVDRATAAVIEGIELAADLAGLARSSVASRPGSRVVVVNLELPENLAGDVRGTIGDRAAACGVRIADFAEGHIRGQRGEAAGSSDEAWGVGLDARTLRELGEDGLLTVARIGRKLAGVRIPMREKNVAGAAMSGSRAITMSQRTILKVADLNNAWINTEFLEATLVSIGFSGPIVVEY